MILNDLKYFSEKVTTSFQREINETMQQEIQCLKNINLRTFFYLWDIIEVIVSFTPH